MRKNLTRLSIAAVASLTLAATIVGTAAAAQPEVYTSSGVVSYPDFTDCDGTLIGSAWTISHKLTIFYDRAGVPIRDIESVEFSGQLNNPLTGATVPDAGHIIYFDTLNPDGSFNTTVRNVVRKSQYIHSAGREDFQTGRFVGMDNWDAGHDALCAALGA